MWHPTQEVLLSCSVDKSVGVRKDPYTLSKAPSILSKEPCILSKEPCTVSKEPYTLSKEPHVAFRCIQHKMCKKALESSKALNSIKRALYFIQTALYSIKRAPRGISLHKRCKKAS